MSKYKTVAQIKMEIEEFVKERERREQETFGRKTAKARGARHNKLVYMREGREIKPDKLR